MIKVYTFANIYNLNFLIYFNIKNYDAFDKKQSLYNYLS